MGSGFNWFTYVLSLSLLHHDCYLQAKILGVTRNLNGEQTGHSLKMFIVLNVAVFYF